MVCLVCHIRRIMQVVTFKNDAQGYGVYAETTSPLEARTPTLTGLNLGSGYGVQGESERGTGIFGKGLKFGVHGVATTTKTTATGVYGSASGSAGAGVEGSCKKGKGVKGTTETGTAVYGMATGERMGGEILRIEEPRH